MSGSQRFALAVLAAPLLAIPFLRAQLPEAPSPAPVQSTADLWNAPDFSVDPKALYEAASAVAAPEGANVVEFADDESFTFDASGRAVHVGHFIYKVLTQKGAEGWDSLSVGWEPWHDARPISARA